MKRFYLKSLFLFFLLFLCFHSSTFALVLGQFRVHSIDSPAVEDVGFSKYNNKTKLLKFTKYVEKPIPLKVWLDTSAYFYFSDTAEKDRFRFSVIGDYEYTAIVYIQILSSKGVCVYKDSFSLMNLLAMYIDGGGYYGTRTQKERAIKEYAETLLSEYNIEGALELLPERLEPDFTIPENHQMLATNGAQKFFSYSKKSDTNTFIGFDPVQGYALKFYETQD
ncbi:MAG: hypothetical protein CFE21_04470 [Bacteroidetes bacterium B1(2017)]|nr:MAG: hypothetical protein CFE21_04470 [Bacteroidetes bacterium B1(2017)]